MENKLSLRASIALGIYRGLHALCMLPAFCFAPILGKIFIRIKEGFNDYFGNVKIPAEMKKPVLWVHGVSMGESMVALGFAKELRKLYPQSTILFTTTHPDVVKDVKKKNIADSIAYFPLDNYRSMNRIFDKWNPDAVFVSETDFWPEFSNQCRQRNIPLMLINGRISSKITSFYSRAKGLAEVVFGAFSLFAVQSRTDADNLLEIGVPLDKIQILGNMKADFTQTNQVDLTTVSEWLNKRKMVVFGSLHPEEFDILKPMFKRFAADNTAVIIAPRNITLAQKWKEELEKEDLKVCLKTEIIVSVAGSQTKTSLQASDAPQKKSFGGTVEQSETEWADCEAIGDVTAHNNYSDIMILDTIGELASVYRLSSVAFVGGSLDQNKTGGHNPLEVLQQNVPLVMGPFYRNFADIVEQLKKANAIEIINNAEEGYYTFKKILNDTSFAEKMTNAGNSVLNSNKGVVAKTINLAKTLLKNS